MSELRWLLTRWARSASDLAADAPHLALAELQHHARRVLAVHDRSDPTCARGHRRPRTQALYRATAGRGCWACQTDRRVAHLDAELDDVLGRLGP